jgi:hypothetical protein
MSQFHGIARRTSHATHPALWDLMLTPSTSAVATHIPLEQFLAKDKHKPNLQICDRRSRKLVLISVVYQQALLFIGVAEKLTTGQGWEEHLLTAVWLKAESTDRSMLSDNQLAEWLVLM